MSEVEKRLKEYSIKKEVQEIEKRLREDANKKLCLIDTMSNFPKLSLSLSYIGLIILIEKRFYDNNNNNNNNKELVKTI